MGSVVAVEGTGLDERGTRETLAVVRSMWSSEAGGLGVSTSTMNADGVVWRRYMVDSS